MNVSQHSYHHLRMVMALVVIASMVLSPFATGTAQAADDATKQFQHIDPLTPDIPNGRGSLNGAVPEQMRATTVNNSKGASTGKMINAASAQEAATYIVVLEGESLATYRGGISGLAATSPKATGQAKLSARAPESRAYLQYIEAQQASFIASASRELGHPLEITYQYKATLYGFAARMTAEEAAQQIVLHLG